MTLIEGMAEFPNPPTISEHHGAAAVPRLAKRLGGYKNRHRQSTVHNFQTMKSQYAFSEEQTKVCYERWQQSKAKKSNKRQRDPALQAATAQKRKLSNNKADMPPNKQQALDKDSDSEELKDQLELFDGLADFPDHLSENNFNEIFNMLEGSESSNISSQDCAEKKPDVTFVQNKNNPTPPQHHPTKSQPHTSPPGPLPPSQPNPRPPSHYPNTNPVQTVSPPSSQMYINPAVKLSQPRPLGPYYPGMPELSAQQAQMMARQKSMPDYQRQGSFPSSTVSYPHQVLGATPESTMPGLMSSRIPEYHRQMSAPLPNGGYYPPRMLGPDYASSVAIASGRGYPPGYPLPGPSYHPSHRMYPEEEHMRMTAMQKAQMSGAAGAYMDMRGLPPTPYHPGMEPTMRHPRPSLIHSSPHPQYPGYPGVRPGYPPPSNQMVPTPISSVSMVPSHLAEAPQLAHKMNPHAAAAAAMSHSNAIAGRPSLASQHSTDASYPSALSQHAPYHRHNSHPASHSTQPMISQPHPHQMPNKGPSAIAQPEKIPIHPHHRPSPDVPTPNNHARPTPPGQGHASPPLNPEVMPPSQRQSQAGYPQFPPQTTSPVHTQSPPLSIQPHRSSTPELRVPSSQPASNQSQSQVQQQLDFMGSSADDLNDLVGLILDSAP